MIDDILESIIGYIGEFGFKFFKQTGEYVGFLWRFGIEL